MLQLITNPVGVSSLAKREILRFLKVYIQTLLPPWINSALFMYIFGIAIGSRVAFPIPEVSYLDFIVPGLLTMHIISGAYENTASSLFIGRWHNNIQEVLLSPLSYLEMVLGLLAGGVARGLLVGSGILLIAWAFNGNGIAHPLLLLYLMLMITVIFSCAGMLAALWADDFDRLNLWNIYVILPMVLMGGVFHPLNLLPEILQTLSRFNPIYYLMSAVRFAVTGIADTNIWLSSLLALLLAAVFGLVTVILFKIGYKLRT